MRWPDFGRLILLAALWGGSFIFIRVAAPAFGPIALVEARVLIAGVTLWLFASAGRRSLGLRVWWRQYLLIGAINSAIPFVLIAAAELHLTASLAAVLNATSPLFGVAFAAIWLREPLTRRKLAGVLMGIAGVSVLAGWSPLALDRVTVLALCASLCGAAFYGLASVYTKARAQGAPALGMAAGSQLAASLLLAPLVVLAPPAAPPALPAVVSMLALALLSTALAYVLYFRLIVDVGPAKALTVTFLAPIFGVTWGALLLGETISAGTVIGCGVILLGTALVTGIRPPAWPWRGRKPPAWRTGLDQG